MRIRALVAALLAALLLPAAAGAVPKTTVKQFTLVSAEVEQTVDWHWQDSATTGRCNTYVVATGDQQISYSVARPTSYQLTKVGGSALLAPAELVRFEGDVTRTADWRPHLDECGVCGGELGECDGEGVRQPAAPRFDCRRRTLRSAQLAVVLVPAHTPEYVNDRPLVSLEAVPNEPVYRNCPPTNEGGPGLPPRLFSAIPLEGGEYRRLLNVRPGRKVELEGRETHGYRIGLGGGSPAKGFTFRCPPLSGPGQQICVRGSVRAVFKRVR
jgi:hypothetical protein